MSGRVAVEDRITNGGLEGADSGDYWGNILYVPGGARLTRTKAPGTVLMRSGRPAR